MQEAWIQSLSQEDPLEKETATHSSILAWEIPWTEEPGMLQSMESERVRHTWGNLACTLKVVASWWQRTPLGGNYKSWGARWRNFGQISSRKILVTWFYSWSEPEREKGPSSTNSFRILGGLQSASRCKLIRSWTLWQQLEVRQSDSFQEKAGRQCFYLLLLGWVWMYRHEQCLCKI